MAGRDRQVVVLIECLKQDVFGLLRAGALRVDLKPDTGYLDVKLALKPETLTPPML